MATTTTVRSASPAMGASSNRSSDRRTVSSSKSGSSRPPPASRGVSKTKSDESLDQMQVLQGSSRNIDMNSSFNNRTRIANMAAKLNDSASSFRSSEGEESLMSPRSKRSDRQSSRNRPVRDGRQRSESPSLEDDDGTVVSTATSSSKPSSSKSTHRESRSSGRSKGGSRGSSRSRSKSRSKSRSRSKSAKASRRRNPLPRSGSDEGAGLSGKNRQKNGETMDFNNSTSFIPPISPVHAEDGDLPKAPATGASLSPSELELMDFLTSGENGEPTNSQRLGRSVPLLQNLDGSGRASRTTGRRNGGSMRRERTTGSRSKERIPSTRGERSDTVGSVVTSSSSYKRPPRTHRGVGRSQSAQATSASMDALLSPRKNLPPSGSSRNRSPSRGVGRSKSTDDMGDLNNFFAQTTQVSRRKKPASGSRSVASMPARSKRNPNRTKKTGSGDNGDAMKPPSSRSTVTESETYDSDEEDDSIDESLEELNDNRQYPTSSRSVESYSDFDGSAGSMGQSLSTLNMEAALQLHMNRTENLLFDVFPKHIAEALRSGRKVEPENHECVTIFFSDIVGFTEISSELDPLKISDLLDRLYNSFDALSHYHDVFKVETIGDAYMAVTNLTKKQPDHCKRIAEFAIDAIRVANQTLVDKEDPARGFVNIRVGFHSGPVVSNVVGSRNPRFCLFGDTVNTASRMESNSAPNRIHCSGTSAELLKEQHPNLRLNPRGTIEVKGKGEMETFWVNEDAAVQSQRNGTSRSIFKILKHRANRRGSVM